MTRLSTVSSKSPNTSIKDQDTRKLSEEQENELLSLRYLAQGNAGRRKPRPSDPAYQASHELDRLLYVYNTDDEYDVSLSQLASILDITKQGVKYRIDRFKSANA